MPIVGRADAKSWTVVGDSGANAAQTLSKAAGGAGVKHYICGIEVIIQGAASVNALAIDLQEGPATNKWRTGLPAATAIGNGMHRDFSGSPIEIGDNLAAELEVPAGGTAVVTRASMRGFSTT